MDDDNYILKVVAFVLLLFSLCFNFYHWVYEYELFGYKIYSETINIKPTLITTLLSILLFGGYIIRNLTEILKDSSKICFSILDIFFFSGFIAIFSNGQTNILGFSSQSILFSVILMMYVGMRSFLRYIILIFIATSFFFISKVNDAMGVFGAFYILFAFISFLIQIHINILPRVEINKLELLGEYDDNDEMDHKDNDYNDNNRYQKLK